MALAPETHTWLKRRSDGKVKYHEPMAGEFHAVLEPEVKIIGF